MFLFWWHWPFEVYSKLRLSDFTMPGTADHLGHIDRIAEGHFLFIFIFVRIRLITEPRSLPREKLPI